MKKYNLGTVKLEMESNGFPKGFILKRDLVTKEARYIMNTLLGINLNTLDDDCYDREEYKEYNISITNSVNSWLKGNIDDESLMEYACDCSDEQLGIMKLIPIIQYLKKKNIID